MQGIIKKLENLIDIGAGRKPADVVIRGAKLLDVYCGTWVDGDLAIGNGQIVSFGRNDVEANRVIEASGKWIVPGFFEAHYHAGGTHMAPGKLARALLAHGTTTTVCDWQEFYVVAGKEAVRQAIDDALGAGIRLFYLVPIHWLVLNDLASPSQKMDVEDLMDMLKWPETVAINEPPPGPVLAKDPDALRVIAKAMDSGKIYSGHAPKLPNKILQSYASTGASSDHESTESGEAWSKLTYGIKVMMRQGSASPDMEELVKLAIKHPAASRHMMLVADEIDPVDLIERGHIDATVKRAIELGLDPIVAYQMVTLNAAEYYRVDHLVGSLAPGRAGDAVILNDPNTASVSEVIVGGVPVDELPSLDTKYSEIMRSPVKLVKKCSASDFRIISDKARRVRVIGVCDGSLLSTEDEAVVDSVDGGLVSNTSNDILKIAVLDRAGEGSAVGFVSGFGIGDSAVATTYAHTFYNLLVVGGNEEHMALAGNAVAEMGGGIAVVKNGLVIARWPLELVGVFSTEPLENVGKDFQAMNKAIRDIGCKMSAPVLALSFVALPTIPELGLTTEGLYHVNRREFLSVIIDE